MANFKISLDAGDLSPENIREGATILGVSGTLVEGGGGEYKEQIGKVIDGTIEEIEVPNITYLKDYAFFWCKNLKKASFPDVTMSGAYIFQKSTLMEINMPKITAIRQNAFEETSITQANFPEATKTYSYAFQRCMRLISVNLPKITEVASYCFQWCTALPSINLPMVTRINNYSFYYCDKLKTITLGANQVCTISSTNSIPAKSSQHITIKVPANLIEEYKVATNWSTHYNNGYITFEAIA